MAQNLEMEEKATGDHMKWTVKSEMELAAGSDDENLSMWQLMKKNNWAILYCCLMSVNPMVFGFDVITVSIATAMPAFQQV
ncbi:hypothetical protein N7493_012030 [Penicillium malachiteum]|uniref:Uncharacterized protein n=1 Tax=Penicillium malachiteum TaxID=1324776 RepID=A0AAD6HAA2_9EURO|nr:hypothetical protein N7493_012030 [Penicillium malachiteum]